MKRLQLFIICILLAACSDSNSIANSDLNVKQSISESQQGVLIKQATDLINASKEEQALPILIKLANAGNPKAQNQVGLMYQYGYVINQQSTIDLVKAKYWLEQAVNQNYPVAIHNLAALIYKEATTDGEFETALNLFIKAATLNHYESYNFIGNYYNEGLIYPKNFKKAVENYKIAAVKNNASGQFNMGQAYYYGEGVDQDYKVAFDWYQKAANQGYDLAYIQLSRYYEKGLLAPKNISKAIKLLEKPAKNGEPTAQYNLAILYKNENNLDKFNYWKEIYSTNPKAE